MDQFDFGQEARRLRVGTLVRLRWIAAAGQIAALLVAAFALRITFPLGWAALCIALLLGFNAFLWLRFSPAKRLEEKATTYILAVDIAQLAALLYLTGGIANPFAMLLLAPTMISAVSQTWVETGKLLALAIACAGLVTVWRIPLQLSDGALFDPPDIEKAGFLLAIVVSAVFVAVYGGQVAKEARQLAGALAATEMILTRAQHLSQLDGLAAAAAHEFGTPLATLTVIVHELANQSEVAALCGEDLSLAKQELSRCRAILGQLSTANRLAREPFDQVELEALLEEVAAPHRLQDIDIVASAHGPEPHPLCARNPALLYGLRNLAENAVEFAKTEVSIAANWGRDRVEISIEDDGPGFPAAVLQRLGEPYISDRTAARHSDAEAGLGLGLFIAKALLERTGAELKIGNLPWPRHGARAVVSWPRGQFEPAERPALAGDKSSPSSVGSA
ncbi:MAG: ActS/PrrB/RegB family redox-sensitive histidine kinase [Pseudomonadota bacterium]|nr:ActS/PrrB/RegB family redox-sensitive histidine kinase [Pseudomonadota bacterium]